jgi:hypothetical protein
METDHRQPKFDREDTPNKIIGIWLEEFNAPLIQKELVPKARA